MTVGLQDRQEVRGRRRRGSLPSILYVPRRDLLPSRPVCPCLLLLSVHCAWDSDMSWRIGGHQLFAHITMSHARTNELSVGRGARDRVAAMLARAFAFPPDNRLSGGGQRRDRFEYSIELLLCRGRMGARSVLVTPCPGHPCCLLPLRACERGVLAGAYF